MAHSNRIGLIVPSSNTTMETELPVLLGRREEAFTFHSARVRMRNVTADELKAMNLQTRRAAAELADASVDVLATACLVAIMAQGPGYHCVAEQEIRDVLDEEGSAAPVVSSAGALVSALKELKAKRVAIITPYMRPLTNLVVSYLASEGIEVADSISLEVPDNRAVADLDPDDLRTHWKKLDLRGCDALVLSACVQMQSLPVLDDVRAEAGIPVLSAATATADAIHRVLTDAPAPAALRPRV